MAVIDNLKAYYSLGEASGNALDAHSGGHTLTETVGTIASAAGKVGNCRDFELGDTEYFTKADHADLSVADIDFSMACWVNLETNASPMALVSKYTGSNFEYQLSLAAAGTFKFRVASGDSYANLTGVDSIVATSTATWYFVVGRHDATANTIDVSVNNGTADSAGYTFGGYDSTSAFWLGGDPDGAYLDGLLDEVGFWKKKLSDAEVTWLYNSGSGRSYADIVAEAGGGSAFPAHYYQQMRK